MGKLYFWIDGVWQWIAERVFVRFEFDLPLEKLRALPSHRIILTLTHIGIIEFLILSSWFRKQGLPGICVANKKRILFLALPKFFLQILFRRKTYAELFLSDAPGPRLLFCSAGERKKVTEPVPVEVLLGALYANSPVPPYHFFPIYVLWRKHVRGASRKPSEYFLGLGSDPNLIGKLWYLVRQRKDSLVKCLPDFPMLSSDEAGGFPEESHSMRLARQTRRRIIVLTHQEMRVILGPRYSSPHAVKETLLRDAEIRKVIEEVALAEKVDRKRIMSRAYQNLTEIVSNYRYRTIELFYVVLRWFFNRVFDGVSTVETELQTVREAMKTTPVVFVSCHRSHFDYLVVPYILFKHDMVTPHIAAGINLSFWPFGPIARSAGAFFIRRSFRGDQLYSISLRKYVEYLLKHRYNIKFFIEGTRSRSGKMLPPAYGLLKMVLEAQRSREIEDITLVPVSITYDEVPEERSYTREIAGGQKTKESAKELLKSREVIKRNFGKVYVRFGESLSTKFIEQRADASGQDVMLTLQKTAFQLCKNINDSTPITAKAIVASIFLGHSQSSLSLEEIHHHAGLMSEYVLGCGYELSSPELQSFRRSIEQTVRRLAKAYILQLSDASVPRRYACDHRRRTLLSLYRNSAIHCFIIPSIVMNSLFRALRGQSGKTVEECHDRFIGECLELRNWLKFDFFFSGKTEFLREVDECFNYFFDAKARALSVEEFIKKKSVEKLAKAEDVLIYCRFIEDLLESYIVAGQFCLEYPGQTSDKKTLQQKILKFGEGLFQKKEISLPESLSVQSFSNAILLLENLKAIKPAGDSDKRNFTVEGNREPALALVTACRDYLKSMREEIPELLKQRQSPTLGELYFSH